MRKLFAYVMILALCLSAVCPGICAAEAVDASPEIPVFEPSGIHPDFVPLPAQNSESMDYSYWINYFSNTLIRTAYGEGYTLVDPSGAALSSVYSDMMARGTVCRVWNGDLQGIIDGRTGEELVPCLYDYSDTVNFVYGTNDGSWNLGMYLEAGTSSDYDLRDMINQDKYFRIVSTDLYHGKDRLATFTREEYNSNSAISLFGKYLFICPDFRNARLCDIYDLDFSPVRQAVESMNEFSEDYMTGVITHVPTGQAAFTEGCTLTAEDVNQPYWYSDNKILALSGEVVCAPEKEYDWISVINSNYGYFETRLNGLYGLIDLRGNEIIPCVCEEFPAEGLFEDGYLPAVVEGKLVFFDETGTVVSRPEVDPEKSYMLNNVFGYTETEDGHYRIFSAEAGLLEGVYRYPSATGKFIVISDEDDREAILDPQGKAVVPFDGNLRSFYLSSDGTVILARDTDYAYLIAVLPAE